MFGDIGWAELMLIGVVALIVIGPEDLPDMFRQLGRFTAKLRQMSREFSRAMEQAAKDSGVKDVADDLKAATSAKSLGLNKVREAADRFEKWDPIKNAAKPTKPLTPPPMPATPAVAAAPEAAAGTAAAVAEAAPVAAPVIHGPATQALLDKQAAKKAILAETTQKLKAVEAGEVPAPAAPRPRAKKAAAPVAEATATPAPRAKKPAAAPAAEAAPKPRAPRKPKEADKA
jgi:sec-independent protein translocase protein TatB